MARYTNTELAEMHLAYGAADCNGRAAQRLYAQRYPNRQTPSHIIFARLHRRLSNSGSFMVETQEHARRVITPNIEDTVLNLVQNNPGISTRAIASQIGISNTSVWRILHTNDMHPYHIQRVQLLEPADFAPRLTFARWYLQMCTRDRRFPSYIMFTDEATFTREGVFNSHNTHMWSEENPHATRTHAAQQRFSVNVWAGIVGNHLVGPYLLPQRLTGANYLCFLQEVLPQLLDDAHISAATRSSMWFQHDGAPSHYEIGVRLHLDVVYGQKWIGRGGPVHWPARSPDLTCLDYFLWGYIKALVYETTINSAEELVARIVAAAGEVKDTPNVFDKIRSSMRRRCEACITANGRNFEHFL